MFTKYAEWMPEVARAMCRLGAIDSDLAEAFGCSLRTVKSWRTAHAEFEQACRGGKLLADAQVANALFNKAIGICTAVRVLDRKSGEVVEVDHYEAPDTASIALWLCNRRPDLWRHVNRVEVSGPDGSPMKFEEQAKDARTRLAGRLAGIAAAMRAGEASPGPE